MDAPVAGRPWFSRPVLSYDLQARVHVICKATTEIIYNMKRTPFARIRLKRDEFTTRGKILSREELDREELDREELDREELDREELDREELDREELVQGGTCSSFCHQGRSSVCEARSIASALYER
jgi:hypothetical protein